MRAPAVCRRDIHFPASVYNAVHLIYTVNNKGRSKKIEGGFLFIIAIRKYNYMCHNIIMRLSPPI